LLIEFRGAAELSFCAKQGKENPNLRKENPSLGEEKSKPLGRKIQAGGSKIQGLSFHETEPFQRVAPTPEAQRSRCNRTGEKKATMAE
jgi:hypothetical protein